MVLEWITGNGEASYDLLGPRVRDVGGLEGRVRIDDWEWWGLYR
jgi:hypothetical protein